MTSVASPSTKIPPPEAKRPLGATAAAVLPVTVELRSVSEEPDSATMPPPFDWTAAAWLSLTVVFSSVIVPQLSIPAASPNEAGHGTFPGQRAFTLGTDSAGVATFPVTALFAIVTFVPWNASIPPPSAVADGYPGPQRGTSGPQLGACGLPWVTPPVKVRFEIRTVGVTVAEPIVSTGPPPLTTALSAPVRVRSLVTV